MATPSPLAVAEKKPIASAKTGTTSLFDQLGSKELVLGLSGPLGSGVSEVREVLARQLQEMGYDVVPLKVSALIRAYSQYLNTPPELSELSDLKGAQRYERYQEIGNSLRAEKGYDFLSHLVAAHISLDRQKRHNGADPRSVTPGKVAYLVDQLKHPDECQMLRAVYRENFYLVGVLGNSDSRKRRLLSEGIGSAEAERIMERDRKQDEKYGQKLEKTLQLADFFVRNSKANTEELAAATQRFLKLIHGSVKVFPTRVEQGMYAAYSAALSSACLSRQVGAAIHDRNGVLIATGCNDVPKGGGGLYQEGQGEDDRCVFLQGGNCFNHQEKDAIGLEVQLQIFSELKAISEEAGFEGISGNEAELSKRLAQKVRNDTRLNDLIEFSRAVHAEMDALVCLARSGAGRSQDGVLFTTTYPCHNCARHIIAAGIRAVYFVEPYEKSLALKLHHDAIDHDASAEEPLGNWDSLHSSKRRVKFFHFEGVAPSRYLKLFSAQTSRKDSKTGKAVEFVQRDSLKKDSQLLESYIEIEARLTQDLVDRGIRPQSVEL